MRHTPVMPRGLVLAAALLLLGPAAQAVSAPPEPVNEKLSIEQAVDLGLKNSPRLRGADLDIKAAEAKRKSVRGRFGPILQFETTAMFFNEPPGMGSGSMSQEDVDGLMALAGTDQFDQTMVGIFSDLPSMFESKKYNVDVALRLVQPLTPLWAVYQGYKLSELEVDVAQVARKRQESELAFQIRQICLRILQAHAGLEALEEAVSTVAAHVERAEHFLDAGLISQSDVLQAKVQQDQLKVQVLSTRHGLKMAQAALAMYLNLPPGSQVEVVAPVIEEGTFAQKDLTSYESAAAQHRPELIELGLRIRQAEHGVRASWQGYLPEMSAMAQYSHNEGSLMTPPEWTGGLIFSWNIWEWGASHYATEEAQARLARARVGMEELQRGISLDVQQAWLKLSETAERSTIAQSAVSQAEERLRMERERYEVQQATSTEVLDAQSRLTQTKVELQSARYEHLIAQAALDKAVGKRSWDKKENKR